MFSGPRTEKCRPVWWRISSFPGSKNSPPFLVFRKGIVGPTRPEPQNNVNELLRPVIAVTMRHLLGDAEILGFPREHGRYQIPPRPPRAQLIQRREGSGDVKWLRIRRRRG